MLQAEQVLHERYQLKQKLGQNSGRQTWLAADKGTSPEEKVVVKLLAFGGEVQWDDLKLFEREAQVLKQLHHPRIPQYRDYFCLDERSLWFGLVQEYIPGNSLKEQLNQGKKFTEKQVRQIAVDLLEILTYLHQLNPAVLHRDIKPSNLIWGEDQHIYLVDFGAVQDRAAREGATFTVVGTYGYAPMEQFGGRAVPASDLYALGATLIHLLTGTAPADLPQKDLRIQFKHQVSLSASFVSWIEQLTEPVPEKRFATAQQALKTLKSGLVSHSHVSAVKTSQPANTHVQLRRSGEELKIYIPPRGIKVIDIPDLFAKLLLFLFVVSCGISLLALDVSYIAGIIILLGSILLIVMPTLAFHCGKTYSVFNRLDFQIKQQLFNFTYYQQNWQTAMIQYVFCREVNSKKEVVIQVDHSLTNNQYSFGHGLTQAEIAWLTQEIQSWLNIR
jgi:serine/threonine protein kinase